MSALLDWPSLTGALRLAAGRPDGVERFGSDMRAAARSFCAAAVALPIYTATVVLSWQQDRWPVAVGHAAALEALIYLVSWAGYAVISHALLSRLGLQHRWPRFIAVWNWVNVVQYILLLVAAVPGAAHAPPLFSETCLLVAQGWALWLEWYAIRLSLEVSGLQAALVMAPDVLLGLVIASFATV
jgi:hypothetical protein